MKVSLWSKAAEVFLTIGNRYKETDTHNYLHFSSFHPDHCKRAIPYSQFLRLRRLCSDDDDFLVKSRDMTTFLHNVVIRVLPSSMISVG